MLTLMNGGDLKFHIHNMGTQGGGKGGEGGVRRGRGGVRCSKEEKQLGG